MAKPYTKPSNLSKFLSRHKVLPIIGVLIGLPLIWVLYIVISTLLTSGNIMPQAQAAGRIKIHLEEMPNNYLTDLLTVEDPNFYEHNGIDTTTPGAGWTTITQGLVKIYFFENFEPGFLKINKIKQSLIALVFNQQVDKRTQLTLFVNSANLGSKDGKDVIGFSEGAKVYFNKEFRALTEDEYLALVAMIIAPTDLNIATKAEANHQRVVRIQKLLRGQCKPTNLEDVYYQNCQ